ncbi:1-(5-phosphoribosyl)-5-[(5-phosphoribosylamino)methylideneamino]imidazole-4-carboxamide isomerase [Buchnera aphidicola (Kurisakia onigurumii)]|uniref:1-(5-phosphoribosyl)-5-[(5- phosphoribosylamino)methylideneamino]imidazole-4- carboxamide isomerase n=1 Tax=Buchnera aphidicola TaxID=9 RepID=UPI0031B7103D
MIIPAMDLYKNKVVRLYQGKYNKIINYSYNINDLLLKYSIPGIERIHIVDLEAAKNPNNRQITLIKKILQKIKVPVQIGGGIRNVDDIREILFFPNTRVVIGSLAVENKEKLKSFFKLFSPEKIVLSLDIEINQKGMKLVQINGWKKNTFVLLEDLISDFYDIGLKHILCTDISKDGTLHGPNFNLYKELSNKFKRLHIQASGGVGKLLDIVKLKQNNAKSIIIGRSFLENRFTVQEAISCLQNE